MDTTTSRTVPANLAEHLSKMQGWAMQTETLLLAAQSCFADPERRQLLCQLIEDAHDIARELNSGLDIVNLPKVAA